MPEPRDTPNARVAALTLEVRALAATVKDLGNRVAPEGHDQAHADLTDMLERLLAAHDNAPPPFHWDDLDDDERGQREDDLRAWVRDVLAVWHPVQYALLDAKPCWWDHLDVRQHVTAAWLAWLGAYRAAGRKRGDPATWLRVELPYLETALQRLLGPVRDRCEQPGHAALAAV